MLPRAEWEVGGTDSALIEPARSVAETEVALEVLPLALLAFAPREIGLADPDAMLLFLECDDLTFFSAAAAAFIEPLARARLELGVGSRPAPAPGEAARSLPSSLEPSGTVEPAEGEDEGCSESSESSAPAIPFVGSAGFGEAAAAQTSTEPHCEIWLRPGRVGGNGKDQATVRRRSAAAETAMRMLEGADGVERCVKRSYVKLSARGIDCVRRKGDQRSVTYPDAVVSLPGSVRRPVDLHPTLPATRRGEAYDKGPEGRKDRLRCLAGSAGAGRPQAESPRAQAGLPRYFVDQLEQRHDSPGQSIRAL